MTLNNEETSSPHFLLIGASRGIGLAMAEELLRRGWQVTATMRAAAPALSSLALRYGQALTTEQLDITDEAQLAALRHRLRHQRFSALFVNAGTTNQDQNQTIAEVSTEEFAHLMITNALAPLRVIEALQDRVDTDGLIGVMSSGQGSIGNNHQGGREVYRGTKAALNQYMRSYAARQARLAPVRALLLLAPGWVRTALGGEEGAYSLEETIPDIVSVIESRRGQPGLAFLDRFGKSVPW